MSPLPFLRARAWRRGFLSRLAGAGPGVWGRRGGGCCEAATAPLQEKVRCRKLGGQRELASAVAQLKPKARAQALPAGLGPFQRKEAAPGGRVPKKLSRAKSARAATGHPRAGGDGGRETATFPATPATARTSDAGKCFEGWAPGRVRQRPRPPQTRQGGSREGVLETGVKNSHSCPAG